MMNVRLRPEATQDVQKAIEWYSQKKIGLDAEFMLCVDEAISRIQRTPQMYPVTLKGLRKAFVRRFPYTIYDEAGVDEILVLAVFHVKRNPKDWQKRMPTN